MICEACRQPLGEGQCPECRALASEMAANAEALEALRYEEMDPLQIRIPSRRPNYAWLAAAAVVLMAILLPRPWEKREPAPPPTLAVSEPLKIKMLTPDPTVVIYWLTDPKEEQR